MEFVDKRQIHQYRKWSAIPALTSDSAVKTPHSADLLSWSKAADMLELPLESDPDQCWKIEQRDSLYPWRLRYLRHALGWQTLFDLTLPGSFPQTCELRAQTEIEFAQRTGNPIVDAEIYVLGFGICGGTDRRRDGYRSAHLGNMRSRTLSIAGSHYSAEGRIGG